MKSAMKRHRYSVMMTEFSTHTYQSWLACRFLWYVTRYASAYQRLARTAAPLWCLTHADREKLRRAGQPFKFAHQPPTLATIKRDAHARVYTRLCEVYTAWLQANRDDPCFELAAVVQTIRLLITVLDEMAAPYMAADRRELGHEAWLRQITRGRVYARAAKDLRQMLAEHARLGGDPAQGSFTLWETAANRANRLKQLPQFNRYGERIDERWQRHDPPETAAES